MVVEIDPNWMTKRTVIASVHGTMDHRSNNKLDAAQQQQEGKLESSSSSSWSLLLPELEPMRLDGLPPSIALSRHIQLPTVRLRLPFKSEASLPCPVRQLGNRTVRYSTPQQLLTIIPLQDMSSLGL